jgi:polysaccharide export outer membrane protein
MAKLDISFTGMTLVLITMVACGQTPTAASPPAAGVSSPTDGASQLGADDVIQIRALEAEEISDKPVRIGSDGYINLPIVGRVKAAGLTVEELQAELVQRLKHLIVNPDVTVSLTEAHHESVSVVGAVRNPGAVPLQGRKTFLEVLSLAGGPRDDAGYTARISRRRELGPLPLPRATTDPDGQFSVAEVNLQNIMEARDPAANILIMPNDVISVPKAQMVYVIGEVLKPGSIVLGDQKTVTVLQAISIAAGLGKTAKSTEAKVLRLTPGSPQRTEVAVNLKAMLSGKTNDIPLQAEDILYVPTSLRKDFAMKTLEALGGNGITSVIYRVP